MYIVVLNIFMQQSAFDQNCPTLPSVVGEQYCSASSDTQTLKVLDQITLENKICLNLKIRSVFT